MSSRESEATWMMPLSKYAEDNVWVMIARIVDKKGNSLQTLRVFTTEPTEANITYQKRLLCNKNQDAVTVGVFEVAVDQYDQDEIDTVGC